MNLKGFKILQKAQKNLGSENKTNSVSKFQIWNIEETVTSTIGIHWPINTKCSKSITPITQIWDNGKKIAFEFLI